MHKIFCTAAVSLLTFSLTLGLFHTTQASDNADVSNSKLAEKSERNRYFGSVCNGTSETLYVAVGVRPTTCGRGGCTKQYVPITTEGWWIVEPRNCERVYTDTNYRNGHGRGSRYVSAYTASYRWEGSQSLCVRNSAFTMQGELGYEDCQQANGYRRGFRQISRDLHVSFQPENGRTYGAPEYEFLLPN